MGLAASQARLLLITSRKSDLEFRAQVINNRMLALSAKTEEISNKYAQATSNRILKVKSSDGSYVKVSYGELTTDSGSSHPGYAITNGSGQIMITDKTKVTVTNGKVSGLNASEIQWVKQQYATDHPDDPTAKNITADDIVNNYCDNTTKQTGDGGSATTTMDSGIEEGLRSGAYQLVKVDASGKAVQTPFSTETCMDDELDTSDDAAAMAEYESKSAQIQTQNKQLDLELKNIDTQHKALESEEESVKKIIDSNVKASFKTFA